jgi:hypothetical protein
MRILRAFIKNTDIRIENYLENMWGSNKTMQEENIQDYSEIISRFTEKFLTECVSTPRLITSTSSAAYRERELSSIPPESSIKTQSRRFSLFSIRIVREI